MIRSAAPSIPPTAQTITWATDKSPIGARLKYETIKRMTTPHTALMRSFSPFRRRKKRIAAIAIATMTIRMVSIMLNYSYG